MKYFLILFIIFSNYCYGQKSDSSITLSPAYYYWKYGPVRDTVYYGSSDKMPFGEVMINLDKDINEMPYNSKEEIILYDYSPNSFDSAIQMPWYSGIKPVKNKK